MIYQYVCERCGTRIDLQRPIADRDEPVWCSCARTVHTAEAEPRVHEAIAPGSGLLGLAGVPPLDVAVVGLAPASSVSGQLPAPDFRRMERRINSVGIHFHGVGWTRGPAIMRDRIAEGTAGRETNWGTVGSEFRGGNPDAEVLTPTPAHWREESNPDSPIESAEAAV